MQQVDTPVIQDGAGDKKIIYVLFGGLSIAPYGVFLLLSAYVFAQGWLDWKTNGGPPYLGGVLAWLLDLLIRLYYRKKYDFVFDIHNPKPKRGNPPAPKAAILLFGIIGLLVAWYVDATFHPQIRFMPLWFGAFVCLRGLDWVQKGWIGYGLTHVLLGIVPMGIGILPFFLDISSNNQYFGLEGVYELAAMGIVIIIISIMEHLIFLSTRNVSAD